MERKPSKQAVVQAIESAIQAEPGSLSESASLPKLSGWDSLGIVSFLGNVSDNFGIELPVDDVLKCATVDELVEMVLRR